jgi:alpha-galactosidase
MKLLSTSILLAIAAAIMKPAEAKPPMGFNNWSRFQCDLNQTLFTDTADAMLDKGLLDAGYDRINLDDCWPKHERDEEGRLQWDTDLFPKGLPWLGKYFKERGFKFGIYSDVGNLTCGDYPGSYGYEKLDAETFASWGIDFLKLDGCNVPNPDNKDMADNYIDLYHKWHQILSELDEPMMFSESAPAYFSDTGQKLDDWFRVMDNMPPNGELARHSWDVINYGVEGDHWDSVMLNYKAHLLLARYQSKSFSNDPDFLVADDDMLTMDERRSQFALWSSLSAPLIISAYIPDLKDDVVEYLTNEDLIAVDQDDLGLQATLVSQDDNSDVLSKDLSNGDRLLTVFNKGDTAQSFSIPLVRAGYTKSSCSFKVKELWSGEESEASDELDTGSINSHATKVYRITASDDDCKDIVQTGQIFTSGNIYDSTCLASDSEKVSFVKCNGKDAQVWQVRKDGTINNLDNQDNCLTEKDGQVSYSACDESDSQNWSYNIHGYVVNKETNHCLTVKNDNSTVTAADCKQNDYRQTFALPISP